MESNEILKQLMANARRASPVIVRGRQGQPLFWEEVDSLEKCLNEYNCMRHLQGVEVHLWNAQRTEPVPAYALFKFSNEQAATEFYLLLEHHELYAVGLPDTPIGLAVLRE